MFDPAKSKFYNELMVGACKLLGLDSAIATEADIDAAMQKAGTLEDIKAAAKNEALLEVKSQMDDFTSRLNALETSVKEKDQTITTLNADIADKTAKLTAAEGDLKTKSDALTQSEDKLKDVAGKLSALQAKGLNDDNKDAPIYSLVNTDDIQPIKTDALDKRLGLN